MKRIIAIFASIAAATFGLNIPNASAGSNWTYGIGEKKLNSKLGSLGMNPYSVGSALGALPKSYFSSGPWPASFSDSISYADLSDGYTPAFGEGEFIFVKGNESSSASTTIVNFELPNNQTIASDGMGYYFMLFPYDHDDEGSDFGSCSAPTKASVSGKTLSVTINCAYGEGFGGYFILSSLISQPGLYENAVVYKTVSTKRTAGNMFKLRMPETNVVFAD